jgi:hypothetical protein
MMTMFTITAVLIGAALGQRFKVFILVPAIVIGSAAGLGFGMAQNSNLWSVLLIIALTITALQMGYLGGAVIRFVVAGSRVGRDSSGTIGVAQRSAR